MSGFMVLRLVICSRSKVRQEDFWWYVCLILWERWITTSGGVEGGYGLLGREVR